MFYKFFIYIFIVIFYVPFCLANDDNYDNKIIEQKDNLNQIQQQIKTLKNDLSNKENDKNLTANKISESTEKINSLQQKLQELNTQYQQKTKQLTNLQNNIKSLDKTIKNNQKSLANLLYWKYINIQQNNIINNNLTANKNSDFKNSYYLQSIIKVQNKLLKNTQKDLLKRQNLALNLSNEQQNLEKIRQTQNSYKEELQQQKLAHQQRFYELDKQVNLQKQKIQTLKEDEKNLAILVEKLTKIAEEQKLKAEQEKLEEQKRQQELAKAKQDKSNNNKIIQKDSSNIINNAKNLILPIKGKIITNFGQKKSDGIISKGVLISAKFGDNVKSIANGKVVFADQMRGFGKLLVIDHQNSYMTVYAHNSEILVSLNQNVQAQQNVAKVGENGVVYFELRKQGKAINPQERIK